MPDPSSLLRFAEDRLQIMALVFMAVVYSLKIRWILHFPAGKDRQAAGGRADTNATRGAVHSLFQIALPWEMASTRRHVLLYAGFVVFHVGVAVSIAMSFLIPYAPGAIAAPAAVGTLQVLFAAACLAGVVRLYRRIADPYIRAISTPDDYFSLGLLIVWLLPLLPVLTLVPRKNAGTPKRVPVGRELAYAADQILQSHKGGREAAPEDQPPGDALAGGMRALRTVHGPVPLCFGQSRRPDLRTSLQGGPSAQAL